MKVGKNKIILEFTASSESAVISWLLWFGEEARLIKPKRMVDEVVAQLRSLNRQYGI